MEGLEEGEGYIRVENMKYASLMALGRNSGCVWGCGKAAGQPCRRKC